MIEAVTQSGLECFHSSKLGLDHSESERGVICLFVRHECAPVTP